MGFAFRSAREGSVVDPRARPQFVARTRYNLESHPKRGTLWRVWYPQTEPWQYRILDALPKGVDDSQIRAALAMSATERVQAAIKLNELAETIRRARR